METVSKFTDSDEVEDKEYIIRQSQLLIKNWEDLKNLCESKIEHLRIETKRGIEFEEKIELFGVLLNDIENKLYSLHDYSCFESTAEQQLFDINKLGDELIEKKIILLDLAPPVVSNDNLKAKIYENLADKNNLEEIVIKMRYYGRKGDVLIINNLFDDYNRRYSRLSDIIDSRIRNVKKISPISLRLKTQYDEFLDWITEKNIELEIAESESLNLEIVMDQHKEHLQFQNSIIEKQTDYDNLRASIRKIIDAAPKYDKDWFVNYLETVTTCWLSLLGLSFSRQRLIDETIMIGGSISDALSNNFTWMVSTLKKLNFEYENHFGRSEYIKSLLNNCQKVESEFGRYHDTFNSIVTLGADIINKCNPDSIEDVRNIHQSFINKWNEVNELLINESLNLWFP
ncbi:dystonin-like [Octopus sinensis]|uniref:Dystonin-like n=1 Tax=Octopus sinensis TaxID=2607531 RepID=A0A6P7U0C1_9MOLL|nr:dystonin-like [Octopus sinensis]